MTTHLSGVYHRKTTVVFTVDSFAFIVLLCYNKTIEKHQTTDKFSDWNERTVFIMMTKLNPSLSVLAMVHSKEHTEDITIIEKDMRANKFVCVTKDGVKCTAIYNIFTGLYYADDLYGVIKDKED